jgi:hypothetical protein
MKTSIEVVKMKSMRKEVLHQMELEELESLKNRIFTKISKGKVSRENYNSLIDIIGAIEWRKRFLSIIPLQACY